MSNDTPPVMSPLLARSIAQPPAPELDLKVDIDDTKASSILHNTQRIRNAVVNELVKEGVPDDTKDTKLLLETLRDLDHTTHQNLKIDLEAKSIDNDRAAQEIVNAIIKRNPQGPRLMEHEIVGERLPVVEVDEIPSVEIVPGETDIGTSQETTKEFLARHDDN